MMIVSATPQEAELVARTGLSLAGAGAPPEVVVCGHERLDAALAEEGGAPIVVLGEPAAVDPGREARIRQVVRPSVSQDHLLALLEAVARPGPRTRPAAAPPRSAAEARAVEQAFTASRRLAAATDLASAEAILIAGVLELVDADRARCRFHDPDDASLWSETGGEAPRRASAGLLGFAACTGQAASVARAGADPRWFPPIDGRDAPGDRLLVHPVVSGEGVVQALLVAVRDARRAAFTEAECAAMASFCALAAPLLSQLEVRAHARALLARAPASMFRREALAAREPALWGDVVRIVPPWLTPAYWSMVALMVACVAFLGLTFISTYSSGPAVLRAASRRDASARLAGTVVAVEASPGARVEAGAVIARLDDTAQRAAVERLSRAFEAGLRSHLLALDADDDAALQRLRVELDAARDALEDRVVRSPIAGDVADLRVRPGQRVEPGDVVASLVDTGGGLEVVALLPGEDRPQLGPGMTLRLELDGYPFAYHALAIEDVSAAVIGPAEARRVVGVEVAESLQVTGPVVLVRGRLPAAELAFDGRLLPLHDGMHGRAEVRVGEQRTLFALVPGARRL